MEEQQEEASSRERTYDQRDLRLKLGERWEERIGDRRPMPVGMLANMLGRGLEGRGWGEAQTRAGRLFANPLKSTAGERVVLERIELTRLNGVIIIN